MILLCLILSLLSFLYPASGYVRHTSSDLVSDPGHLDLAILLGHRGKSCHSTHDYYPSGTQRLLAVTRAISRINQDRTILPNHKLGYVALDGCLDGGVTALAQTLRFLPDPQEVLVNQTGPDFTPPLNLSAIPPSDKIFQRVVGMVGPHTSSEAVSIMTLMELFQLPMVSFSATSVKMSENKYFYRVIAADDIQGDAIIEFVKEMNWTYVSIVHSDGDYGSILAKHIKLGLEALGVCVPVMEQVLLEDGQRGTDVAVRKLVKNKKADVVIAVLEGGDDFVKSMAKYDRDGDLTIIGTEGSDWNIYEPDGFREDVLRGGFRLSPFGGKVGLDFVDWLRSITYKQVMSSNNPFLKYFWQAEFRCAIDEDRYAMSQFADDCSLYSDQKIGDSLSETELLTLRPDIGTEYAAYAFAFALDMAIKERCPTAYGEELKECITGEVVRSYLGKVEFEGPTGTVSFDSNGDYLGSYSLENIQGVSSVKPIGKYDALTKTLTLTMENIQWKNGKIPEATCSQPCPKKTVMVRQELHCCWTCQSCRENEIIVNNACTPCPPLEWPDEETATICKMDSVYDQNSSGNDDI